LALLAALPLLRGQAQSVTYSITDLGTLGGTESKANGISNCGRVVGESSVTTSGLLHPFIWHDDDGDGVSDPGEMDDLGTFAGGTGTAYAVNASGSAVGNSLAANGPHTFLWHDNNGNGTSDPGELQDLGTLPGDYISTAWDINDSSQLVGQSENTDFEAHAFVWNQSAGMQQLPTLNQIEPTVARGINNSGHIVGVASTPLGVHAFFLNGSQMIDLGTLGGAQSIAHEVGETDFVVGQAELPSISIPPTHAFIWHDDNGNGQRDTLPVDEMKDLGTLGGTKSVAYDINASGQVVGSSDVLPGVSHAFIWQNSIMTDLNTLISNPNWTLQEARSINDGGQIVGWGTISGQTHAFLLTPIGFTPPACPTPTPTPTPTPAPDVTVAVSPSSVAEDGATNLTYTFSRTGSTGSSLTVNFSVGGTATFSTDYTQSGAATFSSSTGTVTFGAGNSMATVTVDPTTDSIDEPNETVILTVTSGTGYSAGAPSSATGTITDDDAMPTVSINNVTQAEGNAGTTAFVFTVSLSNASQSTITVDYATAAGTTNPATGSAACGSGTDYVNTSGTLTFVASDTSEQITIQVCGETTVEADETFFVNLSNATNSVLPAGSKGTGTITNDDTDVTVAVSPSVVEDGATNLTYTFTRNGVSAGALTVNFSVGGTAAFNTDYTQSGATSFNSTTGTLTIGAGNSTAAVTVDPTADSNVESDETVILTVTSGVGYGVGSPNSATGTIVTDDAPVIFTEAGTNYAAAIDSVTFVHGPFTLVDNFNFSNDHRTRIILFTSNLGLTQPDSAVLTVQASGIPLTVENVGPLSGVPGLNASYIIVRLPDGLPAGDLLLTVTHHGVISNVTILSIAP
jgi:probable HAF family extracellular repeat protein